MIYSMSKIDDLTGFTRGAAFKTEAEVRAYFTEWGMRSRFGQNRWPQWMLDEMADAVVAHRWHMERDEEFSESEIIDAIIDEVGDPYTW